MGVRVQMSQHLLRLMSAEDRDRYEIVVADTDPALQLDRPSSRKVTTDERKEQGVFANWLLLQNGEGRRIPFCWHVTHTRSKASPGTPDFWIGVAGRGLWFEFKRDDSCKLTPEQKEFRDCCVCQGIEWYLVHSTQQAIEIVQKAGADLRNSSIG
jgi:hypothetical protein